MPNVVVDAAIRIKRKAPTTPEQAAMVLEVFADALRDLGVQSIAPGNIALTAAALRVRR